MKLNIQLVEKAPANIDVVAIPVMSDEMKNATGSKRLKAYGVNHKKLKALGFKGEAGQIQATTRQVNSKEQTVLAVGLGSEADFSVATIRSASQLLVRSSKNQRNIVSYLIDVVEKKEQEIAVQAHAEGAILESYIFEKYIMTKTEIELNKILIVAPKKTNLMSALRRGKYIAEGVNFAKDLVNEPGGSLVPKEFASRAQAMARKMGLQCKVLNLAAIKKANMGGLLGVNRGSDQEPRFVELKYIPKHSSKGHIALVGKGVTFDSGGLSLKPPEPMSWMKVDMSGAAAILGALMVISQLKPHLKVSAYIPMTDNMTSGDATRPGDILKTHNKKTVEVLNTDAEGRLILADALSIASKAKPDVIVDLATLTGACAISLGLNYAGLMGNSDGLNEQIKASSQRTDEKVWEFPLDKDYRAELNSYVADLKNIGGNGYGGTIVAALFLQEFVDEKIPLGTFRYGGSCI